MTAKRTVYHVSPPSKRAAAAGVKWQVEGREGRRLLHEPHRTQKDAIDAARRPANEHQPAQVVVHARDGHICTAYTQGDSPAAPPASAVARQGNPEASSRTGPGVGLKRWCDHGFMMARGFSMLG